MAIRILSQEVANQIAAGEVVERPASVVKELVENSLDAGARHIIIELEEGGKRLIRVSDDGYGIPADEVEIAFHRYATSKLETIEDLNRINTLGFRGEALASIASVCRLTLTTRAAGEEIGTRIQLEGGRVIAIAPIGAPQGTLIGVENLFYNVPARLKFMKKESTERGHVGALVSRYAMAYPDVRFVLEQGNREVLRTTGSGDLRDVLNEVFGLEAVSQMVPVEQPADSPRDDLPPIGVSGYVSLPALNRSNRSQITLFVNGRWVQDSSLTYAVIQAYHTMLMVGRYPVGVLMISVPPEEVDVNVHPTKAEVRFRQPNAVFSAVQRAVRQTLVDEAPPPSIRHEVTWGSPDWAARRDRIAQVTGDRIRQMNIDMEMEGPGQRPYQQPPTDMEGEVSPPPTRNRNLPMLRVVGQVGATYVVAEGPTGLYLIDQHAAHERILYEQLMAEQTQHAVASQELLEAVAVELLPEQVALVEENLEVLNEVGFLVEQFGRNTIRLRAVPAIVSSGDPVEALLAAVGEIESGEMPTEATAEEILIARVCKQVAVKAGQVLSYEEMAALIRQLEECESPRTCPHGRPTMLHMSAEQLAKEFGRLGAI
ncbi:MAG: DNA mismatch repair endonuclease MutL [Anaerolineae bacterium]|nr:DNA mismatch repair endonuclease MutL [Anaerolineae bacterium]